MKIQIKNLEDSMRKFRAVGVCAAGVLGILAFSGAALIHAQERATGELKELPGEAPIPPDFNTAAGRQTVAYDSVEFSGELDRMSADELVRKAAEAYKSGVYRQAIDLYRAAIAKLEPVAVRNDAVKARISQCREAISRCYFYWAEKLYFDAVESADQNQFDQAVRNCELAAEIWPACKSKMDEAVKQFRKMEASSARKQSTSTEAEIPNLKERLYSIDVLLRQGDAYYRDGQWSKARDKYEEVVSVDPYNVAAIDAIRKCSRQLIAAGMRRTNVTHSRYIADANWTYIIPTIPRVSSSASSKVDMEEATPVVKETQDRKIFKKLNDIIIDSMDFEEKDISEVIKWLKERSKQLDPKNEGVNLVYLPSTAGLSAPANKNGNAGGNAGGGAGGATAEEAPEPVITVITDNVPLISAIASICKMAKLKYKVEDYAVLIAPENVLLEEMETHIYPIEKTAYDNMMSAGDLKTYWEKAGIKFDEGASVKYVNGRLVVTNTPANIHLVEEHLSAIRNLDPQVLVEAKFIEVTLNDMEELGFHYLVSRQNSNLKYEKQSGLQEGIVNQTVVPNQTINLYYPAENGTAYSKYFGTWSPGDNTSVIPENVTTYYYTKAPIQSGSKQVSFKNNSSNLTRGLNDISNTTVMDGLFSAQYTNKYGYQVSGSVSALDQADSSDVLACPRITTTNNYPASIKMVTEKYYPSDWSEAEVGTIAGTNGTDVPLFTPSIADFDEAEELGISLTVRPQVEEDGYTITVPMNPAIREFVGWTDYSYPMTVSIQDNKSATYTNILRMPIFELRSVSTLVSCYDGETVVLGGIVRDTTNSFDDQYPLLGNIPLLGRLFQSKAKTTEKKNLLIFMTCRLISPDGSPIREREMRGLPPFRQ